MKYCGQAITPESSNFVAFDEDDDTIIEGLQLKDIKDGRSLYLTQTNKSKAAENDKLDRIKSELKAASKDPNAVDI